MGKGSDYFPHMQIMYHLLYKINILYAYFCSNHDGNVSVRRVRTLIYIAPSKRSPINRDANIGENLGLYLINDASQLAYHYQPNYLWCIVDLGLAVLYHIGSFWDEIIAFYYLRIYIQVVIRPFYRPYSTFTKSFQHHKRIANDNLRQQLTK